MARVSSSLNVLTSDAKSLKRLLDTGSIRSADVVDLYLSQIHKHDGYLHAMLSILSKDRLRKIALELDEERKAGKLRGPLHGIPVIVKDNINTLLTLGMKSSAGSFALVEARPRENARLVDKLIAAGLIIIGKANLSELSNFRGTFLPSGWSAIGGQTQSAYVRGGVRPDDSKDGHSSPSGSSSGSAISVSAGYAPFSVGTETDGSLIVPANRAAVYTIKPTIGLVSQHGITPVSHTCDSAGPMAKTSYDLALLLDVLQEQGHAGYRASGFISALKDSWAELAVGVVDYKKWIFASEFLKPDDSATAQMNKEFQAAYDSIKPRAKKFVNNVPLLPRSELEFKGRDSLFTIMLPMADFRADFQHYLNALKFSPIQNLQALIDFNIKNAKVELPPGHANQAILGDAAALNLSSTDYNAHLRHMRDVAFKKGVNRVLEQHDLDVIIRPADSGLSSFAAAAGCPIATLPLGYLAYNGRASEWSHWLSPMKMQSYFRS